MILLPLTYSVGTFQTNAFVLGPRAGESPCEPFKSDIDPLLLREKLYISDILLYVCHQGWGGVFSDTKSLPVRPISMWPLYTCCGGTVNLLFRSFSEQIVLYVAVDQLYLWEEVSSRSS